MTETKPKKTFREIQLTGTFAELIEAYPEHFDSLDCQPGPSTYPAANREEKLPPHLKKSRAARALKARQEAAPGADTKRQ